jgi:hypothetical protein
MNLVQVYEGVIERRLYIGYKIFMQGVWSKTAIVKKDGRTLGVDSGLVSVCPDMLSHLLIESITSRYWNICLNTDG